jgi:Domain of unknown function (DUF4396)
MNQIDWLSFFYFLTTGPFVLSWYVSGFILTLWIIYDVIYVNTSVSKPLKVGWPIIVFFFSIIGLLLYLLTCRAPGMANLKEDKKKKIHHNYVTPVFNKVTGSVIHCVAGDGLGIMTAMVIGRYVGLNLWSEFTDEYIAGFFFGWILFQYPAMRSMGNSSVQALWKGGRAEFFSMITLMTGMSLTMKLVQPHIVPSTPLPDTYAFWGIASLALFIGTVVTYPMNWLLVSIGWKHGMT